MANSRDLLIRLLGDATGMKKALGEADSAADKHDLSLKKLAGTIGSTYAAKQVLDFGKASVEAAAADEASQVTLATALRNTAGATDEQIAAAERWIEKTMYATGVTDDELRPALERLTRATGDVGKAQGLLDVAMDVSAGTGKSLQAVAEALGKAQDGNVGALARLGIATKDAAGETLSFDVIMQNLSTTFSGQAAAAADTNAGKLKIMQARMGELQEQVGTALMPIMEQLVGVLSGVAEWFSSLDGDTQKWIIRIGMLGGGLVLATRAVNGIIGPLKSLGVIGKTTQTAIDGVGSSTGKMSKAAVGATTALAGIGAAVAVYEVLEARAAAASRSMDAFFESADTIAAEEFRVALLKMQAQVALTGGSVESTETLMKRFVATNIEGARRILDNADAAGLNAEQIAFLHKAIRDAEEATRRKAETDRRYGETLAEVEAKTTEARESSGMFATLLSTTLSAAVDKSRIAMEKARGAAQHMKDRQFDLNTEVWKVEAAARAQATAWDALFGKFDEKVAFNNLTVNLDGLEARLAGYKKKFDSGEFSTHEYWQAVDNDIIGSKKEVDEYLQKLGNVPPSKVTEINALIDEGDVVEVERQVAWLTRKRDMAIGVTFTGSAIPAPSSGGLARRAAGGPVVPGGTYLIGEKGPELLQMGGSGGTVIPNHALGGGGLTVNVAVHGSVMSERDLVRSVYDGILDGQRRGELVGSLG